MDSVDATDVTLDRSQTLNVSLNMSSLGKKTGPTLGTVLPVGLCPIQPSTVSALSTLWILNNCNLKVSSGDARNHQAQKSHEKLLLAERDQKCEEYEQASALLTSFRDQASKWTEFSNRIHKSESEQQLINQVISTLIS